MRPYTIESEKFQQFLTWFCAVANVAKLGAWQYRGAKVSRQGSLELTFEHVGPHAKLGAGVWLYLRERMSGDREVTLRVGDVFLSGEARARKLLRGQPVKGVRLD